MNHCHQLLSGFLANGHLPRVSRQTHLSAKDKGDNEMIPGSVQRSLGVYLTTRENPGKPQIGDGRRRLFNQSCLNGVNTFK